MFSMQFCVCFYSILYICQSHYTVNINKSVTKKDVIKKETNLDTIKISDETIIPKNNTTVENLAENVSKTYLATDNRLKAVERNKSIDNIDNSLLKKNYNISGINLTLNDSSSTDKQQKVTEKIGKPADYLGNKTVSRIKTKLIEDARIEEQNTTVKNDNTTKILQNNDNLTMIPKNNVDMTKIFQNNGNVTKISQMNDNITEIYQNNNDTLKIAKENEFHKNAESKNMTKKSENNDLPKNLKKRDIGMPEQSPNDYNPQDFQNHDARNYQNYDINKNIKNYDMPKNIQQYDPRNIAQNPEMAKKVHNINDYNKPYYQNYDINYKNIINKTAKRQKDNSSTKGHARFYDDSQQIIPQIQTRLNNDLVKKSFDEFKMVRRKTHFTMPDIPIQNDISKREIERYHDLNYNPNFYEYYDYYEGRPRNHVELNYYTKDIPNNILYPPDQEINHIIYPVYEESMPNKYRELNNLLGRQKEIIQKLTKLQMARQKKTTDEFDRLMEDVKKRQKWRNYTKFQFDTTKSIITTKEKSTTTAKPTTVLALFDENEVRLALKNDPNVRRLLKIGNLKRKKYLEEVKNYMKKHNYTFEIEYATVMMSPVA